MVEAVELVSFTYRADAVTLITSAGRYVDTVENFGLDGGPPLPDIPKGQDGIQADSPDRVYSFGPAGALDFKWAGLSQLVGFVPTLASRQIARQTAGQTPDGKLSDAINSAFSLATFAGVIVELAGAVDPDKTPKLQALAKQIAELG